MREAPAASLAVNVDGVPYAAFTAPAFMGAGMMLILASDMAAHGRGLGQAVQTDGSASLLFVGAVNPSKPLMTSRLTLQGQVSPSVLGDREAFLACRPESELYIDFGDMKLYRLALTNAHLVAGFGRAVSFDPAMLAKPADQA